jgi:hypothetical protein
MKFIIHQTIFLCSQISPTNMIYIYMENAKNQEVKYLVTKEFQEYFIDTPIIHTQSLR